MDWSESNWSATIRNVSLPKTNEVKLYRGCITTNKPGIQENFRVSKKINFTKPYLYYNYLK